MISNLSKYLRKRKPTRVPYKSLLYGILVASMRVRSPRKVSGRDEFGHSKDIKLELNFYLKFEIYYLKTNL